MSGKNRPERVAQLILEQLGALLIKGMKDPRVQLVTFTGAKISPDLRQARAYWTVRGGGEKERQDAQRGLDAARGWLRREVGQSLGLRVVPELAFTYDESIDRGERIEKLLREVKEQDAARAAPPAEGGEKKA